MNFWCRIGIHNYGNYTDYKINNMFLDSYHKEINLPSYRQIVQEAICIRCNAKKYRKIKI